MKLAPQPAPKPASELVAMVVDDEDTSQALIGQQLKVLGIQTMHTAKDGQQAMGLIEGLETLPDVLICDIFMPNADGIEFLNALAQMRFQGRVVLVSGGDATMLQIALDIGRGNGLRMLGGLRKPTTIEALGSLLELVAGD
jgi:CheY-like chemotaxis protein